MIQLEPLWNYQKADLALYRFERGLKNSETRNKLLKVRSQIMEQQNSIKRLEQQLKKSQSELRRIHEELRVCQKKAEDVQAQIEQGAYTELKQVRQAIRQLEEATKSLNGEKKLLQEVADLGNNTEKVLKTARNNMLEGKAEFDRLKAIHDEELQKAIDSFAGKDFKPVSFVSPENEHVDAVGWIRRCWRSIRRLRKTG